MSRDVGGSLCMGGIGSFTDYDAVERGMTGAYGAYVNTDASAVRSSFRSDFLCSSLLKYKYITRWAR